MDQPFQSQRNRLLELLPPDDFGHLRPHLDHVPLGRFSLRATRAKCRVSGRQTSRAPYESRKERCDGNNRLEAAN